MPFGSKKKGAKNVLAEAENNNGFLFSKDFILPPEFNSAEQRKILEKIYKRNVGYYKLSKDEQEMEAIKMEKLLEDVVEKLSEYGGSIQSYVGSEGGSGSSSYIAGKKSNTDYSVIRINNVLIFEPFGQANNATFIGNAENEKLKEQLKVNGRLSSIRNELLGRVFHTRTSKKSYNYESGHVLEIMRLANSYPQEFLDILFDIMKKQDYCMLSTIDARIPNCVDDIIKNIGSQVKERGITAKDATMAGFYVVDTKESSDIFVVNNEGVELNGI